MAIVKFKTTHTTFTTSIASQRGDNIDNFLVGPLQLKEQAESPRLTLFFMLNVRNILKKTCSRDHTI